MTIDNTQCIKLPMEKRQPYYGTTNYKSPYSAQGHRVKL